MKNFLALSAIGLAVLVLMFYAFSPAGTDVQNGLGTHLSSSSSSEASSDASSSEATMTVTMEGVVRPVAAGIYMQGSHQLVVDSGDILLLESSAVALEDYVDVRVLVTGDVRGTVEAGGNIMSVAAVQRAELLEPEVLVESSASSESSSSPLPLTEPSASSVAPVSSSSAKPLPPPVISSSSSSARLLSSSAAASSASSSDASPSVQSSADIALMAKQGADHAKFTVTYCTDHIGFCIPLHSYWYFQSFGAFSLPNLWHVEVSNKDVELEGQGAIMINLVSGTLTGQAGVAVEQGDIVIAQQQWTGNRHFEISGPKELKSAIEFMANGIVVSEGAPQ